MIYLDNHATTQVAPEVLSVVQQELAMPPSNPSSTHRLGQLAAKRLLGARESIARFFSMKPQEIFFTSGGTESMNWLIRGSLSRFPSGHVITSNVEHSCVEQELRSLAQGWEVSFLPAGLFGAVLPPAVEEAIRPDTRLVVLGAANTETGVKLDVEGVAKICLERKIPFLVDGVGILGKEPFSLHAGVSGIGFSGHKFHAPKGTGLVVARSHVRLVPLFLGGGQEGGKRAGTENLAGILGLAEAIRLFGKGDAASSIQQLRDRMEKELIERAGPVLIHGEGPRLATVSNLSFPGVSGEDLLIALDQRGVAVSHGSACSSGSLEPSRVLTQMGISHRQASGAIRISLSRYTTQEEISSFVEILTALVDRLRCAV